jgi:hypothetical protein
VKLELGIWLEILIDLKILLDLYLLVEFWLNSLFAGFRHDPIYPEGLVNRL